MKKDWEGDVAEDIMEGKGADALVEIIWITLLWPAALARRHSPSGWASFAIPAGEMKILNTISFADLKK